MPNRIFIIGDSFCDGKLHPKHMMLHQKVLHWVNYVDYHFENTEIINNAMGSRDIQSILDYWIKLMPILTKEDRVIICVPNTVRPRIPIKLDKDCKKLEWSGGTIENLFVTPQHNYSHLNVYEHTVLKDILPQDEIPHFMKINEMVNAEETNEKHIKELIESLYKIAPCKTYMFSWVDYNSGVRPYDERENTKPFCVDDRVDLTEKLGMWTTMDNLWHETNGKEGLEHDHHWDYRTMESFGNYVIDKIK